MADYTTNLNLLKKDSDNDGNDYFNIKTMLNDNWDKIDAVVAVKETPAGAQAKVDELAGTGRTTQTVKGNADVIAALNQTVALQEIDIEQLQNEVQNSAPVGIVSLSNLSPVVSLDTRVNGGLDFEVETPPLLTNLLGRDGDCENINVWSSMQANLSLDSTERVFGDNSIKVTALSTGGWAAIRKTTLSLDQSKNYFVSAYIKNSTFTIGMNIKFVGLVSINSTDVVPTGKFTRVGIKIAGSEVKTDGTNMLNITSKTAVDVVAGQYGFVDGVMLLEITADEYDNFTVEQLLEKYPYVNGIQSMMGLNVMACGKNLFDKNNDIVELGRFYVVGGITPVSNASYFYTKPKLVKPNTQYRLSGDSVAHRIRFLDKIGVFISESGTPATSPDNAFFYNFNGTIADIDTIQLEEGATATAYEPYQGSELLIDSEYAGIGNYRDRLTYKNGKAKALRKVKKVLLDGNLGWAFVQDYAGYKRVQANVGATVNKLSSEQVAQKYDGKVLSSTAAWAAADEFSVYSDMNNGFKLTIADTDSGWGEGYTPTADEVKLYFMGYRMYQGDVGGTTPYTSGTKAWEKLDPEAANGYAPGSGTTIAPTVQNDNANWKPYQLWYALAIPIEEILPTPINGLSVYEGKTTVSMLTGVVREVVKPKQHSGNYRWIVNEVGVSSSAVDSPLVYKTNNITHMLKNGEFNNNWKLVVTDLNQNGRCYAYIENIDYDSTATYEAVYEVLPEECNNQQATIKAEYTENLLGSHNTLVETVSEVQGSIASINHASIAHLAEDASTSVKGHVQLGTGANQAAQGNHGHSISSITGTVPISQGGTGQTTAALARNALGLGNTTGALPIANGGTGATTAAAALTNLGVTATVAELNILDGVTATTAELNYTDGVTSNIQTQLNAKLGLSGGTMSGEINMADNRLTRPYIEDYAEVVGSTPATTGTVTFALTTGNVFNLTPTGNVTIGFSNPPVSGRAGSITVKLKNGTTVYAKTFAATIKWVNDDIPDLSEASKAYDLVFNTTDGGATWHGACIGPYSA